MSNCRWVDVVSSESCASFGRGALLVQERPNRFLLRATAEQLVASLDAESLECLKQSLSESQLGVIDSYIELNRTHNVMDGKTGVTMDLQRKMQLGDGFHEANEITAGDIVESIYNDIYHSQLEQVVEAPFKKQNAKETTATMTSFSGFLDQQQSSQNSVTASKPRSQEQKGSKSPKNKKTSSSRSGSNSASQSPLKGSKKSAEPKTKTETDTGKSKPAAKTVVIAETTTPTRTASDGGSSSLKDNAKSIESAKRQKESTGSHAEVYFDEQTQLPLNPTKKPHLVSRTFDREEVSRILLNQFNKAAPKPKQQDSQAGRLYSRLKDIAIGKSTKGYQNYIRTVPIDQRSEDDPQTPNLRENVSAARFQVIYRKWRTALHRYDNV